MSSAASRLIKFSNNASLQNLIQRHLFCPSTAAAAASGAAVTQLLKTVTKPRFSSKFNAEKPTSTMSAQKASFNASEIILNKYSSSNLDVSMVVSGDQAGNGKILTRRRGDFNDAYDGDPYSRGIPSSDADSGDEGDESNDAYVDDNNDDQDDFDDDDDFDDEAIEERRV